MNKNILLSSIMLGALVSPMAMAELSFDSNIEIDSLAKDTADTSTAYTQSGRVQLNVLGSETTAAGYTISGKGTVNLGLSSETGIDDIYLMVGKDNWDVQVGRFEAANLFPLGKDTVVEHAGGVDVYAASNGRGRMNDGGQIALHLSPSDSLKLELGTVFGDADKGDDTTSFAGVRPVITWSGDSVSISAGYEKVKYDENATTDVSKSGFGVTSTFDLGSASVNLAVAKGEDDNTDQEVTSYAANFTAGNFGAGLVHSDVDNATGADPSVTTAYAAYTTPIFDSENATVTFAGSYSKADDVADDKTTAVKVRLNYTF